MMRNGTKLLLFVLTIFILLVITLASQLTERDLAKLNPLIPKQHYYVQIHHSYSTNDSSSESTTEYTLPAWDDKGNAQTITFFGIHPLREGAYLQLILKNKEVLSYQKISYPQIPALAQQHLHRE